MAEAADVPFDLLLSANTFEELHPLVETRRAKRCTAFVIAGPGTTILAHNEQWLAGDVGCAGIVVDRPGEDAAIVSPTVASWLPSVGTNERGHAQSAMSFTASDDGVGIPRVFVSRHVLGATGRDDAVRRAAIPGRSGGYAYLCASPGGDHFLIETSGARHAVLDGVRGHTNEYLDPNLATLDEAPSPGSRPDSIGCLGCSPNGAPERSRMRWRSSATTGLRRSRSACTPATRGRRVSGALRARIHRVDHTA